MPTDYKSIYYFSLNIESAIFKVLINYKLKVELYKKLFKIISAKNCQQNILLKTSHNHRQNHLWSGAN